MARSSLHGGHLWDQEGFPLEGVLDFSNNLNPLAPPPDFKECLLRSLEYVSRYPDPDYVRLRSVISEYHGLHPTHITVCNGSTEGIYYIMNHVLRESKVMILIPTFSEYERAASLASCRMVYFPYKILESLFITPIEELIAEAKRVAVRAIIICNPNNPTGHLVERKRLVELASELKEILLIIDEAYMDLADSDESLVAYTESFENLVILKSFTKSLSIPGLRLGYIVANKSISDVIRNSLPTWNINTISAVSVAEYLEKYDFRRFLLQSKLLISKWRKELEGMLRKISLNPFNSVVNFLLIRLPSITNSHTLKEQLFQRYRILIRDASTFRGLNKSFIRIAIRKPEDNMKLIRGIKEILDY